MEADGFETKTISVDRLDSETKTQLQYAYFKSTIYDRRLIVYNRCDHLTDEILGLERESDGHIQHPEQGTQGSKDCADAVCGSLWHASLHADEYAYEYGESLSTFTDFNLIQDYNDLDSFTNELKESYYKDNAKLIEQDHYLDFGMGKSEEITAGIADGLIW